MACLTAVLTVIGSGKLLAQVEIKDNPTLGELPYISYYISRMESAMAYQLKSEQDNAPDLKTLQAVNTKYDKMERELEEKKEKLLNDLRQVKWNEVEFVQDSDERFEVVSGQVASVYPEQNQINLSFKIKALTDGRVDAMCRMYCLMLDSEGNVIDKGRLCPFYEHMPMTIYEVQGHNAPYEAGDILCKNQSTVKLYLKNHDYTDFSKVRFVSEETYNNTGK